ncbi:hypothetical protein CR513_59312, partial [Mucuna pruriens]
MRHMPRGREISKRLYSVDHGVASKRNCTTMESSSSDTPQPVLLNSSLSLPKNISRTLSPKIENLVEYTYVPEDAQISETSTPLLSPYNTSADKDLPLDL